MWQVWGEEGCTQGFGRENLKERGNTEVLDLDLYGMVILKWTFKL
jgi:hypothetical protein